MNRILLITLCMLCLTGKISFSQTLFSNVKYQIEAGTYLSTSGQTPFWLRSNQYGIVPLESQFLTLRGVAHKEYDSTKNGQGKQKRFSYGYGLNTVVNVGKASQIILPEAYLKVRYGAFEFYGGRRKEIVGLVDTMLTSGSYIWSGNALPMPKIQISIPNYVSIIGHGLVSIKGSYAHGWFGSSDSTRNFFLHQKTLYGRIGKPNWRVKMYAGFNHQVQWGGGPQKPYIEKQTGKLITSYGNDIQTYWNVVSGISLNTKGGTDLAGVPINDAWNRSGNHLGTVDIATEIDLKTLDLLIYRQSIYEDGSLFYLNNISDGLLGISIKRKYAKKGIIKFTFEYLNTTNQGGKLYYDFPPQLRGGDNYFNNSLYNWAYSNNTIGTPFIITKEILDKNNVQTKTNQTEDYLANNRVSSFATNIHFLWKNVNGILKYSFSENLGIYSNTFSKKQNSILLLLTLTTKSYEIIPTIAIDDGNLYKKNVGINVLLRKSFK